ncbi:MAG: glutaminyl-tRNA synthase (glutamine-hydrolyzing) subunit B [Spirochaetes bacterium GWF1_31_7]|nr:MAG: glutaminyl-tRNA synthase (glutamine-hydrolyzing) subunit B [Spirochaetes bacterium GWE1_32_154]OHD44891.1 MAG: glutaminyl-tRNA synthase (glutamine-hydrolyzing) subunit B [Spirochaetes bacterium GWE2_31_10]OHD48834.1 MAG: glutaminyl-tRNA synthase (glutamine-hydrolyzing) subunit B [Spirochaetes bacterium GWF1_31_7]OHD78028.1 MAG: glutaminyl-tRNA synthase (glutamine-hydrolyzing) subunit B [Spirochaetes bacterium RIFOXYB1_FULL_32_8]HBD92650.1 Asp-tRNA(Asn)/Glu-tRNA(Gln) amidotransferase Gat
MNKPYPIIGLEVHVQLKTKTKAFCRCENKYGGIPNSRVCPVCMGMPGMLPVLNESVLNDAIVAGLAFGSQIASITKFDRKNYSYPDLPKGYQISQYDKPICSGGFIEIEDDNGTLKHINITRIHIEEDAGKLIHLEDGTNNSYVDYNRCGAPLLETVSEPDIRSSDEAVKYLKSLKEIFEYIEISDCNMEEGSLRCDANISMMIPLSDGTEINTPISEVKNINSFSNVKKAIEYEIIRQVEEYHKTKEVNNGKNKITRGFDDSKGITVFQRSKEGESDYRYFPEPDLPHLEITEELINKSKLRLPELPQNKRNRLENQYGITQYDATTLSADKKLSDYFEKCCKYTTNYKKVANFILTDICSILNTENISIIDFSVSAEDIAQLVNLLSDGTISSWIAKSVFEKMRLTNKNPLSIVEEESLLQLNNDDELDTIVIKVLSENQKSVEDYKNGKDNALKYLMGQVMKQSKGKANPVKTTEMLIERLK